MSRRGVPAKMTSSNDITSMLSHLVTLILMSRHDIDMNVMFHSVAMSPIIDVLSALPSHVHVTTRTLIEHVCLSDIGRGSSDSKRDEHFKSLNTWIKAHSYGQASIPLDYLFSPEAKFRARTANLDDVKKLRVSLSTFHSVHNQGRVVFFIPPEIELPDKRSFSPLRFARLLEAGDDGALALARDGGFVIIGDHTQLALKDLRLDFPKNDLWKRMPCEVMFCRREEAAYKNLKSWGILDNVKGQRRAFLSFEAKMLSLRQDFVGLHESGDDPSPSRQTEWPNMTCPQTHLVSSGAWCQNQSKSGISSKRFSLGMWPTRKTSRSRDQLQILFTWEIFLTKICCRCSNLSSAAARPSKSSLTPASCGKQLLVCRRPS